MKGDGYLFFQQVVRADLTGEQLRVLMCLMATEQPILQREIALKLDMKASNVSRSIRALQSAGLLNNWDRWRCK